MKVALVTEWLDPWRGGAETSTQQFMHHLMDRGVELHVFTRSRPSPTPGLEVHTIGGAAMSRTRQSMTFTLRVDRLIAKDRFDIVHAISPCRTATIYQPRGGTVAEAVERNLALIRTRSARGVKRYLNRLNLKQRYMRSIERELFTRDDGPIVVAISDYVVGQLQRHYALPDARIRRIYNGVDPDPTEPSQREENRLAIRREFGVLPDDYLVLLIAHNFRLKGVARWMEALAKLRHRDIRPIRSLVIGRGDTSRWRRLAERLKISDCLTFTGPTQRVRAFHHAADLLVHPTYYDPCSRVVLEALMGGLTCITTKWDGAAEMIEHGRNGFILDDPGNVEGLVDLVSDLARPGSSPKPQSPDLAAEMANRISMSRHVTEMMDLYRNLVPFAHEPG